MRHDVCDACNVCFKLLNTHSIQPNSNPFIWRPIFVSIAPSPSAATATTFLSSFHFIPKYALYRTIFPLQFGSVRQVSIDIVLHICIKTKVLILAVYVCVTLFLYLTIARVFSLCIKLNTHLRRKVGRDKRLLIGIHFLIYHGENYRRCITFYVTSAAVSSITASIKIQLSVC